MRGASASRAVVDPARRGSASAHRGGATTAREAAPRRVVVLDGANLCWGYSAALRAAYGSKSKQPLSRGIVLALDALRGVGDVDVTCFVPTTYVEGPLHGLCDAGDLRVLVARHVRFLGDGAWRNERLHALREEGRLVCVDRPVGRRGADDVAAIRYGYERDAVVVSNDRYNDHASGDGSLRKYLKRNLYDYEFTFGADAERVRANAGDEASIGVGCEHLEPPPGETWDANVHAPGSSRPWAAGPRDGLWGARPRSKKRRSMGKTVRATSPPPSAVDMGFPYWAVDDDALPCTFNPSCKSILGLV